MDNTTTPNNNASGGAKRRTKTKRATPKKTGSKKCGALCADGHKCKNAKGACPVHGRKRR